MTRKAVRSKRLANDYRPSHNVSGILLLLPMMVVAKMRRFKGTRTVYSGIATTSKILSMNDGLSTYLTSTNGERKTGENIKRMTVFYLLNSCGVEVVLLFSRFSVSIFHMEM